MKINCASRTVERRNALRFLPTDNVVQIRSGKTFACLPPARWGHRPMRFYHPRNAREPLRIVDHRERLMVKLWPGETRRFVVDSPWWVKWIPKSLRFLARNKAAWSERP